MVSRRKACLIAAVPAAAGLVALGVFATSLQIVGYTGQRLQAGTDTVLDDVSGCQTTPISVSNVVEAPFSGEQGFQTKTTGYKIDHLDPGCSNKRISLAVKLDSTSGDPGVCSTAPQLTNGDFESGSSGWTGDQAGLDVWTNGQIGFDAYSGTQFAELADNTSETVYQDIKTTPGEWMSWSFNYRGVSGAANQGEVLIGSTSSQSYAGGFYSSVGYWNSTSGTYRVPPGQTTTRFAIRAFYDSYWTGPYNNRVQVYEPAGSYIDNVSFTSRACVDPVYQQVLDEPTVNNASEILAPAGAVPLSSESIQGYSVKIWE